VIVVLGIVIRTTGVEWDRLPNDLILAIVLAGILVGYAEEILFRGIVLRSLRTEGRSEAHAAIFTTIGFGLMHLLNIAGGAPVIGTFGQVALAAISGFAFYLIRRGTTLIIWARALGHVDLPDDQFLPRRGPASRDPAAVRQHPRDGRRDHPRLAQGAGNPLAGRRIGV
jgi:membrane protease YdiL (CAAX protease family)